MAVVCVTHFSLTHFSLSLTADRRLNCVGFDLVGAVTVAALGREWAYGEPRVRRDPEARRQEVECMAEGCWRWRC